MRVEKATATSPARQSAVCTTTAATICRTRLLWAEYECGMSGASRRGGQLASARGCQCTAPFPARVARAAVVLCLPRTMMAPDGQKLAHCGPPAYCNLSSVVTSASDRDVCIAGLQPIGSCPGFATMASCVLRRAVVKSGQSQLILHTSPVPQSRQAAISMPPRVAGAAARRTAAAAAAAPLPPPLPETPSSRSAQSG